MKLTQIAASLATFFYAGVTLAQSKPGGPIPAPEPSVLGLLGLGVVIALVATKFKK